MSRERAQRRRAWGVARLSRVQSPRRHPEHGMAVPVSLRSHCRTFARKRQRPRPRLLYSPTSRWCRGRWPRRAGRRLDIECERRGQRAWSIEAERLDLASGDTRLEVLHADRSVRQLFRHTQAIELGKDLGYSAIAYRLKQRRERERRLCAEPGCPKPIPRLAHGSQQYCIEHGSSRARVERHRRGDATGQRRG